MSSKTMNSRRDDDPMRKVETSNMIGVCSVMVPHSMSDKHTLSSSSSLTRAFCGESRGDGVRVDSELLGEAQENR